MTEVIIRDKYFDGFNYDAMGHLMHIVEPSDEWMIAPSQMHPRVLELIYYSFRRHGLRYQDFIHWSDNRERGRMIEALNGVLGKN